MTGSAVQLDLVRDWLDDEGWGRRLRMDASTLEVLLPPGLKAVHAAVVSRSRRAGARALILTGSTARGRRTEISDLDYHLVGPRIETKDLGHELDVHALSAERLERDILGGDDFVQWSLRFGRVVFDDGTAREALRLMVERRLWPDVERKRQHAAKSLTLAARVVETGDDDGALLQVRTALTLAARAFLLGRGTFPLARAELPAQLAAAGCVEASDALRASIAAQLPLEEMSSAVEHGRDLLAQTVQPGFAVRSSSRG